MNIGATRSLTWRRIGRLLAASIALVVAYVASVLGPLWFRTYVSRSQYRGFLVSLWRAAELAYIAAAVVVPVAVAFLIVVLIRARRRGERRPLIARYLALGAAFLSSAVVMEIGALAWQVHLSERIPRIPSRFDDPPNDRVVHVVAVGESSAKGIPFDRWFSVASIVAWQLERAIPGRRFQVEMQAGPGLTLDVMYKRLFRLKHRPDLMIVYAGHNEFQSRHPWDETQHYYVDDVRLPRPSILRIARRCSPLCRTIEDTLEKVLIAIPPDRFLTRRLIDVPVYSRAEYAARLRDFRVRLEAIVAFCEEVGAVTVLIIPPGNESDWEPNRSMLLPQTTAAERDAFAREFARLRVAEATDPAGSIAGYLALLERQPEFAEVHFRLARLLEDKGEYERAYGHYVAARDFDGYPQRFQSDFQKIYHDVAERHPRAAILVDGPALFHRLAPHGLPGDSLCHDVCHPSLAGYTAIAQAVLTGLHARRVFDWPREVPAPVVTPRDCATHYGLNSNCWAYLTSKVAWFYDVTAFLRYDTTERLAKAKRFLAASHSIARGTPPEDVGLPGIGIDPKNTSRVPKRVYPSISSAATK